MTLNYNDLKQMCLSTNTKRKNSTTHKQYGNNLLIDNTNKGEGNFYQGIDENICYVEPRNKNRITKEHYNQKKYSESKTIIIQ